MSDDRTCATCHRPILRGQTVTPDRERHSECADDLTECIARVLNREGWTCSGGAHEPSDYDTCKDCQHVARDLTAAVMSVVAPAIQAAKTEALKAAADVLSEHANEPQLITWADKYSGYYQGVRTALQTAEHGIRTRIGKIEKEDHHG